MRRELLKIWSLLHHKLKIMKPPWCTYDEHEISPLSLDLKCLSFIEFSMIKILYINLVSLSVSQSRSWNPYHF
jgi:hypothetical protein